MKSTQLIAAALGLSLSAGHARFTYVDASTSNTTLADGTALPTPATSSTADDQWDLRTFANGGTIFCSNGPGGAEDAPRLRTTLTGLTPGEVYTLSAYFWGNDGAVWRGRVSLRDEAGNLPGYNTSHFSTSTFSPMTEIADGSDGDNPENPGPITTVDASGLENSGYFSNPVLVIEDNRFLAKVVLGEALADSNGEIQVFIDDLADTSDTNRTWYDGLGYATPEITYLDANESNTRAVGGTPDPFFTSAITSDDLWRFRDGFGFDIAGNNGVYEKDGAAGGYGDAATLETTISGLTPNTGYAVYVNFLSANNGVDWRIQAGLSPDNLQTFSYTGAATENLGLTSVEGSNRDQLRARIGNTFSDSNGEIKVYLDDTDSTSTANRTWYDGVSYGPPVVPPPLPGGAVEVAPDGVWTWFNDERAIWHLGKLYCGYVDSNGNPGVAQYDPATGTVNTTSFGTGDSREVDDHNNPSLTARSDGRLLAVYSRHNTDQNFYYRISLVNEPANLDDWTAEQTETVGASNTYSNTFRLTGESDRIYNFHRAINFNPTISISDDEGQNWGPPIHFIDTGGGGTRPYVKYASNNSDRIDLIYTDGHPRNEDNSIYHLFYESGGVTPGDGSFRLSDGSILGAGGDPKTLADIIAGDPIDHDGNQGDATGIERGTVIYAYTAADWNAGTPEGPDEWIPAGRAWTWDVLGDDGSGNPVCAFQVQRDNVTGNSGFRDDRIYYYYARWTGTEWQKRCIAQGGRPIYSAEDDYGGGMAIDPDNPNVVYISSNHANPFDLSFDASGFLDNDLNPNERYEIYRGVTSDGGLTFTWEAITVDSPFDNLRPIVPPGHGYDRHALWFYGDYTTYRNYQTSVLGLFVDKDARLEITGIGFVDGTPASDFYIEVAGGVTGRKVTSSDNLTDPFTDVSTTHDGNNRFFISPANRSSLKDFFRIEEE